MINIKEWFEQNYLDGDKVQDGQTLASSECLDAIKQGTISLLEDYCVYLEGQKKEMHDSKTCAKTNMCTIFTKTERAYNNAIDDQITYIKGQIDKIKNI